MAQPPPDQNFYHHAHPHPHPHAHAHPHSHPQLQLPPQFRNPFDLLFDDRSAAMNYNYMRPYMPNQMAKPGDYDLSDSLVMRRPRRTRTTFTSSQIAELEQHFLQGRYLTAPRLAELSAKLSLGTAQVKIWFKNRRRRHKIQIDQHKDQSYDGMPPLSPSIKSDGDPPSLQTLSLNGNGNNTTDTNNALTPSSTPIMDHYSDSFNSYYYNGHQGGHHQAAARHGAPGHNHQYTSTSQNAVTSTEFFSESAMSQHEHQVLHQQSATHQHHQQSHQNLGSHQLQQQQQQPQQQQQYHSHRQFDFQQSNNADCRISMLKDDAGSDFNFNNPYFMHMTAGSATMSTVTSGMAIDSSSAMSPSSDVYEPLTPKNDESPNLCNGNSSVCGSSISGVVVDASDDIITSNKQSLQSLEEPCKTNGLDKACDSSNTIGNGIGPTSSTVGIRMEVDACNGAFSKYGKLPSLPHESSHESNYQCTMDTIMQAYNSHRNPASNTQFAYCFN